MTKRLASIAVAIAVIAGGSVAYVATRDDVGTYRVTAEVGQAPNLFAGGRVMVRGVEVGEIAAVEPGPDGVRIEMDILDGTPIPATAQLSVIPITVISDRYVQFFPAYTSGPKLADGDHIPVSRTTIPAELEDVLAQLKGLLSTLEPAPGETEGPLARLIRNLNDTIDGRAGDLRGSIQGSAAVLENLADSQSDITELIRNLDGLFLALANRSSEIGIINERFKLVAESLAAHRGDLEGTIENLTLLSDQGSGLVDESGDQIATSLRQLQDVVEILVKHEDDLIEGSKWTNVIAEALGATDGSGRGIYAYAGRQNRPEYRYRIDQRDTIACERIDLVVRTFVGIGTTDPDELTQKVLDFIPVEHWDDVRYLVRQLVPLCYEGTLTDTMMQKRVDLFVEKVARQIGREKLQRLLAQWLVESLPVPRRQT